MLCTANFCDQMDQLFNALHSSSLKKDSLKMWYATQKGHAKVINFLEAAIPFVAAWRFEVSQQLHMITG